jgi:hypothetical protein
MVIILKNRNFTQLSYYIFQEGWEWTEVKGDFVLKFSLLPRGSLYTFLWRVDCPHEIMGLYIRRFASLCFKSIR